MALTVKICGINSREAAQAAIKGGADMIGLVFFPRSPRHVNTADAAVLAREVPREVRKVGLFVDADDDMIGDVVEAVALDMVQLHGSESPQRVAAVKARFGLPVMKAVAVAGEDDLAAAGAYIGVADRLLFDAKPPVSAAGAALPGGNACAFDWRLLSGHDWPVPWMLSGGLTAANLAEAVAISGARAVDVSSGVEDRRGHKDPDMIRAFLAAAARL